MSLLPAVVLEPKAPATRAVIWLHGLGADGHDFEPIVPLLGIPPALPVRFVFPHAPSLPVTINGGYVMPAWYDIASPDLRRSHDEVGIRRSADAVRALIARENQRGVPTDRIVLAGFSQGGAIALFLGLRLEQKLAGILALSTYLVAEDSLARDRSPANAAVPILLAHGTRDPMVPLHRAEHARDALRGLGYAVEWKTYPMEHQVCDAEIADIGAFLGRSLGG